MKVLVCGYAIEPVAANATRDQPAMLKIHRMGTGDCAFLAPDEALGLIAGLVDAVRHLVDPEALAFIGERCQLTPSQLKRVYSSRLDVEKELDRG